MFNHRPDGKHVATSDPIVQITPYFMPMRCDAMVFLSHKLDYEVMARYIGEKSLQGEKISFMEIILAAYVRAVSQCPEVNRFIINKKYYSRRSCTTSFVVLRDKKDKSIEETTVKVSYDLTDTIFDVRDRIEKAVQENRGEETAGFTLKLARIVMALPLVPDIVIMLVRILDRYGILPKAIIDALPFHTGLFITNNASIGLNSVLHHIYNFGNTSLFMSMGAIERSAVPDGKGGIRMKRFMPIGVTADERVCAGAMYSKFFSVMLKHLNEPELLEKAPAEVRFDPGCEYHEPKLSEISNDLPHDAQVAEA